MYDNSRDENQPKPAPPAETHQPESPIDRILRELRNRPPGGPRIVDVTDRLIGPISFVGIGGPVPESVFAERIHPAKYNFSPKFAAIVGAIIGHDYGVIDGKGGTLTSISITSDGFVVAGTTSHESGGFIGTASELEANLQVWKNNLTPADRAEFERLYDTNVPDWRRL